MVVLDDDVELGGRPGRVQVAEVLHATALPEELNHPAAKKQEEALDSTEVTDVLQPIFSVGSYPVWSLLHLTFILVNIVALAFVVAAFVILEITNIVCSLVTFIISGGLVGESRQLEVLTALRKEEEHLGIENDRLEKVNEEIAQQVVELSQLQRGFEKLQSECQGNVSKAQELIKKSNTSAKMSAVGVVTRLFKDADANHNFMIDPNEIDVFVSSLGTVFRSVDTFAPEKIREILNKTSLHATELKQIVDLIFAA
jgi:hypothetical protein